MATGTPAFPSGVPYGALGTTGNWTPQAGSQLLVGCLAYDTGGSPVKCVPADGLSTVYTEIADAQVGTVRLTVYSATGVASQRQVTTTAAGAELRQVGAVEITGAEIRQIGGSPSIASDTDTAGDPAIASWPLGAPLSTSTVLVFISAAAGSHSNFATISGYTELAATTQSGGPHQGRIEYHHKVGSPGSTQSTTSTNTNAVMIAVELVEPSTFSFLPQPIPPAVMHMLVR